MDNQSVVSLCSVLLSGIMSIVGVCIGARLSFSSQIQEKHRLALMDSYSKLFSSYIQFLSDVCYENVVQLLSACESVRLLCSDESNVLLESLEYHISRSDPDAKECQKIIDQLRISAQNDIRLKKQKSRNNPKKQKNKRN